MVDFLLPNELLKDPSAKPRRKDAMKLWKVTFTGYWPVGTVAIARADTNEEARRATFDALSRELKASNDIYSDMTAEEIEVSDGSAIILLDGNY